MIRTLVLSLVGLFAVGCEVGDVSAVEANEVAASRALAVEGSREAAEPVELEAKVEDCCTADASQAGIDFMQGILDNKTNDANHMGCVIVGKDMTCCVDPGVAIQHPDPVPAGSDCFGT